MKTKFFYSMILVLGLLFAGSAFNSANAQTQTPKKETTTKPVAMKYTCPEHHDVVMNKPGKCPKCGMALVVKKDMKKGMMEHKKDTAKVKHCTK
jgi:hypothetical protein